jgi:hypothetical protein
MVEEGWARAQKVRDKLAAQLLDHPDVSLVDIGLHEEQGVLAVRVHVRPDSPSPPEIPDEVDGVPVRVVAGDYYPESGAK